MIQHRSEVVDDVTCQKRDFLSGGGNSTDNDVISRLLSVGNELSLWTSLQKFSTQLIQFPT